MDRQTERERETLLRCLQGAWGGVQGSVNKNGGGGEQVPKADNCYYLPVPRAANWRPCPCIGPSLPPTAGSHAWRKKTAGTGLPSLTFTKTK